MKSAIFIILAISLHSISYCQFATSLGGSDRGNYGDRPGSIGRDAVSRDAPSGSRDQRGNGALPTNGAPKNNSGKGSESSPSLNSMFGNTPLSSSFTNNNSNVSKITKDAIVTIQNNLIQLKQTKGILIGSQLTILFQNPAEVLGSVLLAIKGDDWASTIGAMKNINAIQKQTLERDIQNVIFELETSPPFPGRPEEIKFWKKFDKSIK